MSGSDRLPAVYVPHGGGPWHVMENAFGDAAGYATLSAYLKGLGARFREGTRAILMISAHWEEDVPVVHFGEHPGMLYDYYGFPESTYSLSWPAPGSPAVAGRVEALLRRAGFATRREDARG